MVQSIASVCKCIMTRERERCSAYLDDSTNDKVSYLWRVSALGFWDLAWNNMLQAMLLVPLT
jgi:hypothetical protein